MLLAIRAPCFLAGRAMHAMFFSVFSNFIILNRLARVSASCHGSWDEQGQVEPGRVRDIPRLDSVRIPGQVFQAR